MCIPFVDAAQAKDSSLLAVTVRSWIRDKLLNAAKKVNAKSNVPTKTADSFSTPSAPIASSTHSTSQDLVGTRPMESEDSLCDRQRESETEMGCNCDW